MKLSWIFLIFLLPGLSQAGAVSQLGDGNPLRLVYIEMNYLYETGLQIHEQYDFNDPMQVMECKNMHGYILTRARSMIGTAGQIKGELRDKVIDASWHAYACASCGTKVESCDPVPENMEFIKQEIQKNTSLEKSGNDAE